MAKTVLEKFGRIDILVNNAGFAIYGTVSDLGIEEIEYKWQLIILEWFTVSKTFCQ